MAITPPVGDLYEIPPRLIFNHSNCLHIPLPERNVPYEGIRFPPPIPRFEGFTELSKIFGSRVRESLSGCRIPVFVPILVDVALPWKRPDIDRPSIGRNVL